MSQVRKQKGESCAVNLHNFPLGFEETLEAQPQVVLPHVSEEPVKRIIRSVYELQKSAAHWQAWDFMEA